jgi:hypothetical protein
MKRNIFPPIPRRKGGIGIGPLTHLFRLQAADAVAGGHWPRSAPPPPARSAIVLSRHCAVERCRYRGAGAPPVALAAVEPWEPCPRLRMSALGLMTVRRCRADRRLDPSRRVRLDPQGRPPRAVVERRPCPPRRSRHAAYAPSPASGRRATRSCPFASTAPCPSAPIMAASRPIYTIRGNAPGSRYIKQLSAYLSII